MSQIGGLFSVFAFQGPDQELVGFFHERFGRSSKDSPLT